jgi:hypothetical protein
MYRELVHPQSITPVKSALAQAARVRPLPGVQANVPSDVRGKHRRVCAETAEQKVPMLDGRESSPDTGDV